MPAKKLRRRLGEFGVEDESGNLLIGPSVTTRSAVRIAAGRLAKDRGESVYVLEVGEDSDGVHIVVDREEVRPTRRAMGSGLPSWQEGAAGRGSDRVREEEPSIQEIERDVLSLTRAGSRW